MKKDSGVLANGPLQTVCMKEEGHAVPAADLAIQESESCLQAGQASCALSLIRHESPEAARSSLFARGRPVKVATF